MLTIGGDVDGLSVTTTSIKKMAVAGDLLGGEFSVEQGKGMVGMIEVGGNAEVDLQAAGKVNKVSAGGNLAGDISVTGAKGQLISVSAGGDFSASVRAFKAIKSITAGGEVTSDAIVVEGTGKGSLNALISGGNLNVANLDVDGAIKNITVGTANQASDLAGSIAADSMINKLQVFGDIYAEVRAGAKLNTVSASGSLMGEAVISCEDGDISKVLIGDTIYGTLRAKNGSGRVKQVQYHAFKNGDTDMVDSALQHIDAEVAATKFVKI